MKNETKSIICKYVSGVMGVIATITLALGFCSVDSADIAIPLVLIGTGCVTAIICFVMEKFYFYYRRAAKKERARAAHLKKRWRKILSSGYTKISA